MSSMIPDIKCYNKKGVLDQSKSQKRHGQIENKINQFGNYYKKFTYDTASIQCVEKILHIVDMSLMNSHYLLMFSDNQ